MVKVIWSPQMCLFERRQNKNSIFDKKLNMYERVLTYEGQEHLSEQIPVWGGALGDWFIKIASSIAQHISNVSYDKIWVTRMVLNLKIDKLDHIWFCWCSSIWSSSDKKSLSKDPWMKMKPLSLNDNMLIPSNALKSKIVLSPAEIQKYSNSYFKLKKKEEEVMKEKGEFVVNDDKETDNFIINQQSRCLSCWT